MSLQSIDQLTQQLESQGVVDYICFNSAGLPATAASGCFDGDEVKAQCAYSMVMQASGILRTDEKLHRVTATFEDCKYVATVMNIAGQGCGVVIRRSS
eukprot:GILI01043001.1.p1 GENE.GILI01043001.1~~GILI01043001.1.p1  ORF type:complete len:109 (+),score=7.44 GILI01043001.1:36-329(+)